MAAGRGLSLWSKVKGLKGIVFVRWVPSQVTIFSFNNFTLFIKGTWGHAVFHLSGVNKARRRMMTLFSLLSKLHLTKNVGGFFFLVCIGTILALCLLAISNWRTLKSATRLKTWSNEIGSTMKIYYRILGLVLLVCVEVCQPVLLSYYLLWSKLEGRSKRWLSPV